jgi:hypothetical protein
MVSNMELGNAEIPEYRVRAICQAFDVNPDWIQTGEGEMFLPPSDGEKLARLIAEYRQDPFFRAIVENYISQSKDEKEAGRKRALRFILDFNLKLNDAIFEEAKQATQEAEQDDEESAIS